MLHLKKHNKQTWRQSDTHTDFYNQFHSMKSVGVKQYTIWIHQK